MNKKGSERKMHENAEVQARIASMQAVVHVAKQAAGRSGGPLREISDRGDAPLLHSKDEILRLKREAEFFLAEFEIDQIAFLALLDPASAALAGPDLEHVRHCIDTTTKMVEHGAVGWQSVDVELFADMWRTTLLQHGRFFTRWTAGLNVAIETLRQMA